jgi:hypothetical protein
MRQDCRNRAPTKARLQSRLERGVACGFVALVHLFAAWILTRPPSTDTADIPALQLVFVQLPPPEVETRVPPTDRIASPAATTRPAHTPPIASPIQPAAAVPADIPQSVGNDRWDIATGPMQQDDGIRFDRRGLPRGFNPIRMGSPERFRMRGRASLADIVRTVSKELFWPSGYSDDPCPGLRKAVQIFSEGSTDRQRDLLEDAVLLHSRFCD